MNLLESLLAIAGLIVVTLVTRGFFVLPRRELPLPDWLRQGLRHAPVGALVAVVLPEIVMTRGAVVHTLADAKLAGAAAAIAWVLWRRDMLGTIVVGTAVMLICRLGLGW